MTAAQTGDIPQTALTRIDLLLVAEHGRERVARARRRLRRRRIAAACCPRPRNVDARGIEISQKGVNDCVAKGLSVVQGDADVDLADYPDDGFDYVILSQTLQATRNPRKVLEQMLRIGKRAIVSFPNFGHWRIRWQLGLRGRMPITENLSYAWYETPNIHFCTIRDFVNLVAAGGRPHRQGRGDEQQRRADAGQCAVVGLEPVRRTGGVPAGAPEKGLKRSSRRRGNVAHRPGGQIDLHGRLRDGVHRGRDRLDALGRILHVLRRVKAPRRRPPPPAHCPRSGWRRPPPRPLRWRRTRPIRSCRRFFCPLHETRPDVDFPERPQ